jgi:hypothetical protein
MKKQIPDLTENVIISAIQNSGYFLEQRISNIFTKSGFTVSSNTRYKDPSTGKPREIDLLAYKTIPLSWRSPSGYISYDIIGECKNKKLPIVFIENMSETSSIDLRLAGSPTYLEFYGKSAQSVNDLSVLGDLIKVKRSSQWCSVREGIMRGNKSIMYPVTKMIFFRLNR